MIRYLRCVKLPELLSSPASRSIPIFLTCFVQPSSISIIILPDKSEREASKISHISKGKNTKIINEITLSIAG